MPFNPKATIRSISDSQSGASGWTEPKGITVSEAIEAQKSLMDFCWEGLVAILKKTPLSTPHSRIFSKVEESVPSVWLS